MTNQGIAVREEAGLTKAGLDHTRDQLKLLEDFVKEVLRKDEDYGVIPGTTGKSTLLKPGAANITAAFNCHAEPTVDASTLDPDTGFVSYEVHVDLVSNHNGLVMTRGVGSCNSYETKYRYRWQGRGPDRIRVLNEDPLEQANTIKKMATKRAEVDAAMRLPGVARFFTQDLEDNETIAGETTTTPKDNRFYCADHKMNWTRRGGQDGKPAWYSHKQGNGWCNMKEARLDAKDKQDWTEQDHAAAAQQPPETQSPAEGHSMINGGAPASDSAALFGQEFPDLGSVYTYAQQIGFPTMKSRLDVPGFQEAIQATDWPKAAGLLKAAMEKAGK